MWKRIFTLLFARNKEFYRDKSTLFWNFLFPFLIILGFSFIFNDDNQILYKVGVIKTGEINLSIIDQYSYFKQTKYIEFIDFNSEAKGLDKLKHHRVDLLIKPDTSQYWVSSTSPKGFVVEKMLHSNKANRDSGFQKQSITGIKIPYVEWLFPGILGMNMMFSSLFGVGFVVVRYRKNGVLKRLSVTPTRPYEFITAQVLSRMFIMLLTTTIVYAGCMMICNFECRGSYLSLLFIFFLGGFSMIVLGLLVASRSSSEELAGGILNLITFPMMFLSEVWFSLEGSHPWVQIISRIFPLTHMIDCARKIMNDGAGLIDLRYQVLTLSIMSAVFLLVSSLLFKWHKN